jgi:large subunit ribosomal protein L14e
MGLIEQGRVCIITKGADAGEEVVVKQVVDKNFVIISGETVKERRANIRHLEPTGRKVQVIPVKPVKEKKEAKELKEEKPEKKKRVAKKKEQKE